jgi:pimeloyl-ACP methyl ester carboxylesterase
MNQSAVSRVTTNIKADEMTYASSVDGTAPLCANICYPGDGKPKPIIVVMHGLGGGRNDVAKDIRDFAARGLFAVVPDMRGRGTSAGKFDCGGLDVYDIVDALLAAISRYPAEIDKRNINIVGYSGGGANCFSVFVRFPDLFHVVAPFFGVTDYGQWYHLTPQYNDLLKQAVGGTPEELPLNYAARNTCPAAGNNRGAKLHIFYDEAETICPPVMDERFLETYHAAGLKNATVHISRAGDAARWRHGYRTDNPMLEKADDTLVNEIFAPLPDLSLPKKGTLTVCGYLVTRQFKIFIENGQRGVVRIEYDLTGKEPKITVKDNPAKLPVKVSFQTPFAFLKQPQ